jgi:hypothetical protein
MITTRGEGKEMNSRFVPDSWQLNERLRDYAKSKGLNDPQIEDQEEAFRLCQFPKQILCWDRAWQRWIRNAIDWGKVIPARQPNYRKPQEVSEEQRKKDIEAWERDMRRLRVVK